MTFMPQLKGLLKCSYCVSGDCTDCNVGKSNNEIAIIADNEAHYKEPKKKIDWQDKLYCGSVREALF